MVVGDRFELVGCPHQLPAVTDHVACSLCGEQQVLAGAMRLGAANCAQVQLDLRQRVVRYVGAAVAVLDELLEGVGPATRAAPIRVIDASSIGARRWTKKFMFTASTSAAT